MVDRYRVINLYSLISMFLKIAMIDWSVAKMIHSGNLPQRRPSLAHIGGCSKARSRLTRSIIGIQWRSILIPSIIGM